jgi:glycerol uptake facilitator-like aquaporin
MFSKQKIAIAMAEFLGVVVLATAVFSMVALISLPYFPATIAGLVLGLLIFVLGSVSAVHINPAITLGLWTIRKVKTLNAIFFIAAQMLGGLAAVSLIAYFIGPTFESTSGNPTLKAFIAEGLGALVFGMGVAGAIYNRYEGGKFAFTVGASLSVGILVASLGSNGIINPAVAVGLKSWNLAYALGPIVGSIVGMNLYALLFAESSVFKVPTFARRTKPVLAKKSVTTTSSTKAKKKPVKKASKKK